VKYESNPVFIAHNTWGFVIFTATANPVCIVGAGPSGLTVANKLQATRLETVIFEKNSGVSGKCQAYYNEFQVAQFKVCTVRMDVVNLITISAAPGCLSGMVETILGWMTT
jgi:heterodisulfide reductase subunit A-like polyferredoxin